MGDVFLLSKAQMARISPHFPLPHGVPRVDDRRVASGIIYVIRNGDRMFASLVAEGPRPERLMIDATHLKAYRTAASLIEKGKFPAALAAPRVA